MINNQKSKSPQESCKVERNAACRARCPSNPGFWAVGPTCVLKILQLCELKSDNQSCASMRETTPCLVCKASLDSGCKMHSRSLMKEIHGKCTLVNAQNEDSVCNFDSCINIARTF